MPVNQAEQKLFMLLEQRFGVVPKQPVSEPTITDFRKNCEFLGEFTGVSEPTVAFKNEFIIARDGYKIPIRIYNPEIVEGKFNSVLVFYPGCGYICDLFEANAIACSRIAKYSGMKVIIVNFRLAPENHLPISIYDAYDVTKYIALHNSQYGIDTNKIFIGGLSSGAHCAAVISDMVSKNREFKICHQILLNGNYDLTESNHNYDDYEKEDKICTRTAAAFIFKQYGVKVDEYKNPMYSPLYQKISTNFPSTTIITGEYDGLRNDSEAYYAKLKNAKVEVEKIILSGQTHNTIIMRKAMSDGEDPAKFFADIMIRESQINVMK